MSLIQNTLVIVAASVGEMMGLAVGLASLECWLGRTAPSFGQIMGRNAMIALLSCVGFASLGFELTYEDAYSRNMPDYPPDQVIWYRIQDISAQCMMAYLSCQILCSVVARKTPWFIPLIAAVVFSTFSYPFFARIYWGGVSPDFVFRDFRGGAVIFGTAGAGALGWILMHPRTTGGETKRAGNALKKWGFGMLSLVLWGILIWRLCNGNFDHPVAFDLVSACAAGLGTSLALPSRSFSGAILGGIAGTCFLFGGGYEALDSGQGLPWLCAAIGSTAVLLDFGMRWMGYVDPVAAVAAFGFPGLAGVIAVGYLQGTALLEQFLGAGICVLLSGGLWAALAVSGRVLGRMCRTP